MINSRYRDWRIWSKNCTRYNLLYRIFVLLGITYSPTFEVFHNRRSR